MIDPRRLRPLKQFAEEASEFTVRSLRHLIAHAEEKGFGGCFVKVGARVFIDTGGLETWLGQQQAQPQPHLCTVKQLVLECPGFTEGYLRHLIAKASQNGFKECVVKVGARVFIDRMAFTTWLDKQQAQPQPHQRGIARKRKGQSGHNGPSP